MGAGLSLVETMRYFLATGDEFLAIEGCLSGTLGFLCTKLEQGMPFSSAVDKAR